jgi:hypothetical protein
MIWVQIADGAPICCTNITISPLGLVVCKDGQTGQEMCYWLTHNPIYVADTLERLVKREGGRV